MKIAVIDCGSNTFNLLVAEASQTGWTTVFQSKLPVKLGSGGYENKLIKTDRFTRGIDAFFTHYTNIRNFGCEMVFAFATSAMREAGNGSEFITKANELTGITIEIIDGEREAELTYKGVAETLESSDKSILVMDIGGGSTEFILADNTGIKWKQSFPLGVSRLFDKAQPSDPVSKEEIKAIKDLLKSELQSLHDAIKQYQPQWFVGSSGSFDTLAELFFHGQKISLADMKLHNEISLSAFPHIYDWLIRSTYRQRLEHPVIPAIRAEYMPLAVILMDYVLRLHKFDKLIHSAYSLKEGAMTEIIQSIEWPAEIDANNEKPEDYLEA